MEPSSDEENFDPAEFWERRYRTNRGETGQMWSGRVNAAVAREVTDLTPGTALELGSGEGADALWLAAHGWAVTAVEISMAALEVASAQADRQGVSDRIIWEQADLTTWRATSEYDLVTSAFLHSPFDFPREAILRRAAAAVAPGGRLLIVGHAMSPPGSGHEYDGESPPLPTPDEVLEALELDEDWKVETNALVERITTGHNGHGATLVDAVLRVRRLPRAH